MALASAVYYGALTFLVFKLGTNLELVTHAVAQVNLVLGIVAVGLIVIAVAWFVRRRRQEP